MDSEKSGYNSVRENIDEYAVYSALNIPEFIKRNMRGIIPGDYRTSMGIDLAVNETALAYCTPDEIVRVAKARSLKRQIEWLCGRIALKELLRRELFPALDYRNITISYNSSGSPFISGYEDTGISVSHSGDFAMAALHRVKGKRIGIDLEKIHGTDMNQVMQVAFSPEEQHLYKNAPMEKLIEVFTMKEAYLKVTGQGFHEVIKKVMVKDSGIIFDGVPVNGVKAMTKVFNNEYVVSIIYEV